MKPAIRVEQISKQYRLGMTPSKENNLSENLRLKARHTWDKVWRLLHPHAEHQEHESFWALKDVSFEVRPGEVVGIIGRNGAGKSTLLKILSQIVEPTSGSAEVRGRMGSLLEVGTGFHPELTGRENIYLNGSILGMSKSEINKKFDAIVAFSEIEKFLDTPVKRYSSGMYVRLAFSVAAYLEPEILVVDEVLAVGDIEFQNKCLGKLGDVIHDGRTVLFVSHNMAAIRSLCNRCIYLSKGAVRADGDTADSLQRFLNDAGHAHYSSQDLTEAQGRTPRSQKLMTRVELRDAHGAAMASIQSGSPLAILVEFSECRTPFKPVLGVVVRDQYGTALFGINNRIVPGYAFHHTHRSGTIICILDALPLAPGLYSVDLYLGNEISDLDVVLDAIRFQVIASDYFQSGKLPPPEAGPFLLSARWDLT
jgi:lipopolysaccharide transport system ATP-binding protein